MCTTSSLDSRSRAGFDTLPHVTAATFRQFARFVIVGLASNGALYLLYLALTRIGTGHKVAMSMLFLAGTIQTFFFNKTWSFKHRGGTPTALVRYGLAYGVAYLVNLIVLIVLVDWQQWPHEYVQGLMILTLAMCLFIAQKLWVFREP